jgi:hypothetical protein
MTLRPFGLRLSQIRALVQAVRASEALSGLHVSLGIAMDCVRVALTEPVKIR